MLPRASIIAGVVAMIAAHAASARADDAVRIEGFLQDGETYEPLAGAVVSIDALGRSTVTAEAGDFVLDGLPAGELELRVVVPGRPAGRIRQTFEPGEVASVIYIVDARGRLEAGEAIVVAGEFKKEPPPPPPAAVAETVDVVEASRVAGSGGDAGKVVQNLAGVARPTAGSGALVVWGAAPRDTAVLVDGVELPTLYHLGGVRSVFASGLVARLELQPGAFGADVGHVLGGVVRVTTAPLPDHTTARIGLDVLDGSVAIAGALAPRLRAEAALRGSWVDRIADRVLDDTAAELFSLPRYQDGHVRLRTVIGEGEHVDVVALGAHDRLVRTLGAAEPATARRREVTAGFARLWVRWQRDAGGVQAAVTPWLGVDDDGASERSAGIGVEHRTRTWRGGLRAEYRTRAGSRARLGLGADLAIGRSVLHRTGTLTVPAREGDPYVFGRAPGVDVAIDDWATVTTELAPNATVELDLGPVTVAPGLRIGALVVDVNRVLPDVGTTPTIGGARFDWLIEPRLAVIWRARDWLRVSGALGRHHRAPSPEDLSAVFGNPALGPEAAWCATAAVAVDAGVAEIEAAGFVRDLDDLATRSSLPAPLLAQLLVQDGTGSAFGGQLTVRRSAGHGVSGWIAYTLSRSERVDHPGAEARPFDFDQTHVLTAVGNLERAGWVVGARLRIASGVPRTPVIGAYYEARLDRFEPVFGAVNSTRIPTFVQLDLRVERAIPVGGAAITAYLEVLNATARDNAEEIVYSHDYALRDHISGVPVLGVVGVEGRL